MNQKQINDLEPKEEPFCKWDDTLPGFGVRVMPSGTVAYLVRYRVKEGPQRTHTIGRRELMTLKDARASAIKILGMVGNGEDPRGKKPNSVTVGDLCDRYVTEYAEVYKKPSSVETDKLYIRVFIKPIIGEILAAKLVRAQIQYLHSRMKETPYQANRCLALVSKMMNLAEVWEIRTEGSNPVRHVKRFKEQRRDVSVETEDLVKLARAMDEYPVRRDALAAMLILVTGCRKMEILNAKWPELKRSLGLLKLPDSKTGADGVVLNSAALWIIDELEKIRRDGDEYICGSTRHNVRRFWDQIRKSSGLPKIRIHDLRHIFASIAEDAAGGSRKTVQGLLRHSQSSTTDGYLHARKKSLRDACEQTGKSLIALFRQGSIQDPV